VSKPASPLTAFEKELARYAPAWALAALAFRTEGTLRLGHDSERRTLDFEAVHHNLERRRARFEAGDSMELLHAILYCGAENVPLPTWLVRALPERLAPFLAPGGPTSLDDVFITDTLDTSPARGYARRRAWNDGVRLWRAVHLLCSEHERDPRAPQYTGLDSALDAAIARIGFAHSKSTARRLVEMIDAWVCKDGRSQPISKIFQRVEKR
jgi:hypothetical protein